MKAILVAGLLAITSVAAFAGSNNGETWGQNVASSGPSLTHAQVVAELHEAQANNTIAYGEQASKPLHVSSRTSVLTRHQVRDGVLAMEQAGQFPASGEFNRSHI